MSRKNSIIFFIFIYLVTIAVLLKSAAPAASGSGSLTAMLIESSLPCMEVVEASDAGAEAGSSAVTAEDTGESGEKTEAVKKNNGKPRVLI